MTSQVQKNAGIALIVFTTLMVFTMILHPVGGSVEYLQKVSNRIIITHAIAILSVPFGCMGFWGLTQKLGSDRFFSVAAFAMILFGLVAVLIAAATNGLVLPIFIQKYRDATPDLIESIRPILRYSFSVNTAFDYIYTGAFTLAMLFWSIVILNTRKLQVWIGWTGILLSLVAVGITLFGMSMASVQGFRFFASGIVAWILIAGIALVKNRQQ